MFNYYYYTNSYYMLGNILVLVGVALMALAQMKVSSAYNKYSKVQNSRHLTGYDVAREILDQHGLFFRMISSSLFFFSISSI